MLHLFRKKYRTRSFLPDGMDLHCHLLPGTDDGATSTTEALEMIACMKELGIRGAVCTPHISLRYPTNRMDKLRAAFADFRRCVQECQPGFSLELAAEYMLDEGFRPLAGSEDLLYMPKCGTATNRQLLIELSPIPQPEGWMDTLFSLQERGITPILAHPERYHHVLTAEEIARLRSCCIRLQGNLGSLAGHYGSRVRERCLHLHHRQLYDYWGTDAHSPAQLKRLPLRP